MTVTIRKGDCRDILRELPDESVHCIVTSPPYWGLRDYGVVGQLGMEASLGEYLAVMVGVFREVRRVLRKDGTLWLNLGDNYANNWNGGGGGAWSSTLGINDGKPGRGIKQWNEDVRGRKCVPLGLKPKDLCGIPWRVAFALQEDGWYLRQDIIWSKPNPMPESIRDRCTKAHEYLFLLSKSERYYYDAEAIKEEGEGYGRSEWPAMQFKGGDITKGHGRNGPGTHSSLGGLRNKRSVWEVVTQPFSEAHFATFPPALIEPCIKAGTSERGCCAKCGAPWVRNVERSGGTIGKSWHNHENDLERGHRGGDGGQNAAAAGWKDYSVRTLGWSPACKCDAPTAPCTVLDPFAGAGTTGLVADRLQRSAILIELKPEYVEMTERRIVSDGPLFAQVTSGTVYDGADDFAKSYTECLHVIRERKAAGGKGWTPP